MLDPEINGKDYNKSDHSPNLAMSGGFLEGVSNFLTKGSTTILLGVVFVVVLFAEITMMSGAETTKVEVDLYSVCVTAIATGSVALLFAYYLGKQVIAMPTGTIKMQEIATAIQEGATAFLKQEYKWLSMFVAVVAALITVFRGDPATAVDLYRRAQALPDAGEGAYLGEIRVALAHGRFAQALERAEAGMEAVPGSLNLLGTLARMLAAGPDPELRDGERAFDLAERYFAAGQSLASGEIYALALAESGRCEEAAEWQQQLIEVASNNGAENLVPAYRADLERYRSGPPCRPPVPEAAVQAQDGGTAAP